MKITGEFLMKWDARDLEGEVGQGLRTLSQVTLSGLVAGQTSECQIYTL